MDHVRLHPLDESNVESLLELAVTSADPEEVMPPVAGPPGWSPQRMDAFRQFYRERFDGRDNTAYLIMAGEEVAGMIRMSRCEPAGTVQTGMWVGRPFRGQGIGTAALRALLLRAIQAGAHTVIADTTPTNAAALGALRRAGADLTPAADSVHAAISVLPSI